MTHYLDQPVGWLHPQYAQAAYDELSLWGSRFGALLFDHLEIRRDVQGLDIACGSGFPLIELAHVHGASSQFIGLDLWRDALVRARGKRELYGLHNVALIEGNAQSMPFRDASFDLITSNLGINNFDDPQSAMAECFRVARPNARLAVTTNLAGHMASFYDVFRETLRELGHEDLIPALNLQEAHRGTRQTTESLIRDAGFRITRIVESEFFLPFADGSAMFRHPLVNFFLWGWRGVTEDRAVYERLEEKLNAAAPLRMRIPMLYVEAVRQCGSNTLV